MTSRAKKLYQELLAGKVYVALSGGEFLVVYPDHITVCSEEHLELVKEGVIQRRTIGRRVVFVLGTWIPTTQFFGSSVKKTPEQLCQVLLSRYPEIVQQYILKCFTVFGKQLRRGKLPLASRISELEFYAEFPREVVREAIKRYFKQRCDDRGMPPEYLRGIVRGLHKEMSTPSRRSESSTPSVKSEQDPYKVEEARVEKELVERYMAQGVTITPDIVTGIREHMRRREEEYGKYWWRREGALQEV